MRVDQQALVDALLGRADPPTALTGTEHGVAAYRNNLRALSAQALAVAFERLHGALGEAEFASLAWTFWRHHPPERGDLGEWGAALVGFLVERAGEASGLPDLARLDWASHQAERAHDVELDAESLQLLGQVAPEGVWLVLRPGTALLTQRDGPVLVWRQGWRAMSQSLTAAEAAFFRAVLAGVNLADALQGGEVKGSGAEADLDFSAWLQAALMKGWLHKVSASPHHRIPSR